MKKIITAINNPQLNEELKKEKNFKVIGKDIQYKEAILEILEQNSFIDLIIISEKILGEISFEKLIEKIKLKNESIKIIFILERENENLEKMLIKNNIIDFYYNNKINLKELIKIINKKEINMEEEIIKLKKIIEEKDLKTNKENKNVFNRRKILIDKINQVLKTMLKRKENIKKSKMATKIITFSGNYKSGKSTLALVISQYLSQENKKVLLIDGDLEKQDLCFLLKRHKQDKNKKTNNKKQIYYNFKNKKMMKFINQQNIVSYYKIKNVLNSGLKKLNKKLYFFYQLNYLLENKKEKILIKYINQLFSIMRQKYDFIIIDLSKTNLYIINRNILKNSDVNFLILEANLLGIKEMKKMWEKYTIEMEIEKEKLHIIVNKKNIQSINTKIISNCFLSKNKILEIKSNKIYSIFINHFFTTKYLLENNHIKKDIKKVLDKIKNSLEKNNKK